MADAGYGPEHQAKRASWEAHFAAGGAWICRKCGLPIVGPWDLGHGRDLIRGGDGTDSEPEHPKCNRSAGGKVGNSRRRTRASRTW